MLGVICALLFSCTGAVFAAPTLSINHRSATFLIDNKPVYDNAYFRHIDFWFYDNRAQTEADKSVTGSLEIKNSTYSYYNEDWKLVDVNNQDKIFDLKYDYGDAETVEFSPKIADRTIYFHKIADGGLQNKAFSWSILGSSGRGVIHNFRTTQQQVTSYVPYAELSGNNLIARMVNPSDISKAVNVPYKGNYSIRAYDRDSKTIFSSELKNFTANTPHTMTFSLTPEAMANAVTIRINAWIFENAVEPEYKYRYVWYFWRTNKSNEGVSNADAAEPINLKVGEETVLDAVLKEGYYGVPETGIVTNPVFIGDKSVLQSSWSYNETTRTYSVTLKGLKDGVTDASIYYQKYYNKDTSIDYQTIPLKVTVSSGSTPTPTPTPTPSSSGGGCNTGFMGLAVLALSAIILRKKS